MAQPVPKKIQKTNPQICNKEFNTLLIDGSNILELSSLGDKTVSSNGKQTGGIFQFLLQIKNIITKREFPLRLRFLGRGKLWSISVQSISFI